MKSKNIFRNSPVSKVNLTHETKTCLLVIYATPKWEESFSIKIYLPALKVAKKYGRWKHLPDYKIKTALKLQIAVCLSIK